MENILIYLRSSVTDKKTSLSQNFLFWDTLEVTLLNTLLVFLEVYFRSIFRRQTKYSTLPKISP